MYNNKMLKDIMYNDKRYKGTKRITTKQIKGKKYNDKTYNDRRHKETIGITTKDIKRKNV
jgi:hypothetical protein